jgi:hypothetical protein
MPDANRCAAISGFCASGAQNGMPSFPEGEDGRRRRQRRNELSSVNSPASFARDRHGVRSGRLETFCTAATLA